MMNQQRGYQKTYIRLHQKRKINDTNQGKRKEIFLHQARRWKNAPTKKDERRQGQDKQK